MKKKIMQPIYRYRYRITLTTAGSRSRNYASTRRNGNMIMLIGGSHLRGIRRNLFNIPLTNSNIILKPFNGAKKRYETLYISIIEQKPDIAAIHYY